MRVQDAPPPGWYPDPEGGLRLRWWEGTDWADRWHAPPTPGVTEIKEQYAAAHGLDDEFDPTYGLSRQPSPPQVNYGGMTRADSEAIVEQIRRAAREEVDRAAGAFGREARSAANSLGPLVSQYTNKVTRWFRILATIAVVIAIAYVAFQIFAQASLFQWIGDRIDNLTDDQSGLGIGRSFGLRV